MNAVMQKLKKKMAKDSSQHLILEDVNRPLYMALFGIGIYGKEARDEDIMELIIGGKNDPMYRIRRDFKRYQESMGSKLTKKKDGTILDPDGFMVLQPK